MKRHELGFNAVNLYEQLFDAAGEFLNGEMAPRARQSFKTEFIFQDSRMEGIDIDIETAAEIVVDLRLYGNQSAYCREENKNIIEVAGLSAAYDYVFDSIGKSSGEISIYEAKSINEMLSSTAPCPEFGVATGDRTRSFWVESSRQSISETFPERCSNSIPMCNSCWNMKPK